MTTCKKCGKVSEEIAEVLSLCADCIHQADTESLSELSEIHAQNRERFGLAASPPSAPKGVRCKLCQNQCKIQAGGRGYCGVRRNENGRLEGGTAKGAAVSWYYDPLPTNCVADWVCAEGGNAEHRKWAHRAGPEKQPLNLAVFYQACTFDCLFCQNWHYRERSITNRTHTAAELTESVTPSTACICFFGGDPTCQLPHALAASRLARRQNQQRRLRRAQQTRETAFGGPRICWETNGSMDQKLLDEMMDLSLESGGCVKFDLKAMDANIHYALCGVDNRRTLENFAAAARRIPERPQPPPLVASTLLVPGYIDAQKVKAIASFIAELDPNIPYALLGFHADFLMKDLPSTSWKQAEACLSAAEAAGLEYVRIGNIHTLR